MKRNISVSILEILVFLSIMFSCSIYIFSDANIFLKSFALCLLLIINAFLQETLTDTFSDRVLIFFKTKIRK